MKPGHRTLITLNGKPRRLWRRKALGFRGFFCSPTVKALGRGEADPVIKVFPQADFCLQFAFCKSKNRLFIATKLQISLPLGCLVCQAVGQKLRWIGKKTFGISAFVPSAE
jgi:hypothetical protein